MRVEDLERPLIRGDVWRIRFLSWDERRKRITKYAVILQEGRYFLSYRSVAVVLLTTRPPKEQYSLTTVTIPQEVAGTTKQVSTDCSLVYRIAVEDLIQYAYRLPDATMEQIDDALILGLGLVRPELKE